jgi:hypothetical protein
MRFPRSCAVTVACFSLVGLTVSPALAQSDADRSTARALGGDGQQALDSKDYKTAEDRFRRADSLVHVPTLMIGLARALTGLGRYVEAQETYTRIIREGVAPGAPEAFKRALADAKREVDGVGPKIGGVTITVRAASGLDVPNAKVALDGAPVNTASLGVRRSIDPGSHVLRVSAEGFKPAELHFEVVAGGSLDEPVTLEGDRSAPPLDNGPSAAPTTEPPGLSPGAEQPAVASAGGSGGGGALPWVAFGVGGAGLAVGAITGVMAMGKHSDLANSAHCSGTTCDPSEQANLDTFHTLATISTIGFIVGGVGVAAGALLLVARPRTESLARAQAGLRITPVIGPASIGAVGQF